LILIRPQIYFACRVILIRPQMFYLFSDVSLPANALILLMNLIHPAMIIE